MPRLTMREVEIPAFEDLQWLGAFARRLTRDADEAEDLVQETLVTAWASPPAEPSGQRPWLATVLRNRLRMRRRSSARRVARDAVALSAVEEPSEAPDRAVARIRVLGHLTRELERLPAEDQQLIVRRFLEGQSAAEIARALSLPAGTVRSRLHRLLARLRERLDKRCDGRDAWCAAVAAMPLATGPAAGGALPATARKTTTMLKTTVILTLAGASAAAAYVGLRETPPRAPLDAAAAPSAAPSAPTAPSSEPATHDTPRPQGPSADRARWETTRAALDRSLEAAPPSGPAPMGTDTRAAYAKLVLACVRDLENQPSTFSIELTEVGAPDLGTLVSHAEVVDTSVTNEALIECAEQSMYAYLGPAPAVAFERTFRLGMRLPGAKKRSAEQLEIRLHLYMDARFEEVRACEPAGVKGTVDLDVTADATGSVSEVELVATNVDAKTAACIRSAAATWTFPEPVTTQTTRHRYFLPIPDLQFDE